MKIHQLFLAILTLYALTGLAQDRPIRYQDVAPIFQNRCSACHNPHIAARTPRQSDWSDPHMAQQKKAVIEAFVIHTQLMPKKWSPKFPQWPASEQALFRGWLRGETFQQVGLDPAFKLSLRFTWPEVELTQIQRILTRHRASLSLRRLQKLLQEDPVQRRKSAQELYWMIFYLGKPPITKEERRQLLRLDREELISLAAWLKGEGVAVSYQWLEVRAKLQQRDKSTRRGTREL